MTGEQLVHILLVEDNAVDAEIVKRMLGKYARGQFEVDSVGSTKECEEALATGSFDIILLDNCLPGENGLSFLGRLSNYRDVPPTIMLTGHSNEGLARVARQLGAYDCFPKKSTSSENLAHAVYQCLEKYRLDMQLAESELEGAEEVIVTLAAAAEAKDPATEGHMRRMAHYTVEAGRALGLDDCRLVLLRYAGMLHDIGNIGLSEAVLFQQPGSLTAAEWEEIRQHPIIGERICRPLRFSHMVGPIIRHHHERWDGQGYVDGLAGEEIPFLARVVSVVDAFDAMSSDRPYRKALPPDETICRLHEGAGSRWDPDLVDVVARLVQDGTLQPAPGRLEL